MKKIHSLGAMVLVFVGSVLLGQEVQKPYSYTFEKNVGDCTFTGVSIDQVWAALIKTFMTQDTKHKGGSWNSAPVDLDRPSNHMVGSWLSGHGLTTIEWRFEMLLEQRSGGVGAYCTISLAGGKSSFGIPKKKREAVAKAFFDKVAELLYGKVEN